MALALTPRRARESVLVSLSAILTHGQRSSEVDRMGERCRRVLVVDDQPEMTAVLEILFALLGYEVRGAVRGREALEVAREFDPVLVILDIVLPDMSGYEVARAMRAGEQGVTRYIAALTGLCRPDDMHRFEAAGFDQYLVKPVGIGTVKQMLRRASSMRPVAAFD